MTFQSLFNILPLKLITFKNYSIINSKIENTWITSSSKSEMNWRLKFSGFLIYPAKKLAFLQVLELVIWAYHTIKSLTRLTFITQSFPTIGMARQRFGARRKLGDGRTASPVELKFSWAFRPAIEDP